MFALALADILLVRRMVGTIVATRSPSYHIVFAFEVRLLFSIYFLSAVLLIIFLARPFCHWYAFYSYTKCVARVQYAILLTGVVAIGVHYVLHTIDHRHETPWEMKSVYMLYSDLVLGTVPYCNAYEVHTLTF